MERRVYFIFTDTGTLLSKAINLATKTSLNHITIVMDDDLEEAYSFGRKRPHNPFIGGFVKEDFRCSLLSRSKSEIYYLDVCEDSYDKIYDNIKRFEAKKNDYKYNFIGLFYNFLKIERDRENHYFCSEFVAEVVKECREIEIDKHVSLVRPADFRTHESLSLLYTGLLEEYVNEKRDLAF